MLKRLVQLPVIIIAGVVIGVINVFTPQKGSCQNKGTIRMIKIVSKIGDFLVTNDNYKIHRSHGYMFIDEMSGKSKAVIHHVDKLEVF